jgi:hypothetical protein
MTRSKKVFGLVALIGALATSLVSAPLSSATHPRPKGATPLYVPLVVAYKQCSAANSTHNLPLNFPSCTPPAQDSSFLTVGTPDANGAGANETGFARLTVKATSPEDVLVASNLTDVRCKAATSASVCTSGNTADGPDYSGGLQGFVTIRITDHSNGSPNFTTAGTVIDLPLAIPVSCANTADTSVGGSCSVNTTVNSAIPGAVPDGKRGNVEVQAVNVNDGGASGSAGAADATRAFTQGIFIP